MIDAKFDYSSFNREMDNLVKYSVGYLDGIHSGKKKFFAAVGVATIQLIKEYIDASARVNPEMLHHIYEWYQTGSPDARLYDINYVVSGAGLTFMSSLSQSKTVARGSREPFYDKARIMEDGVPVIIKPRRSDMLVFDVDGKTVFTPNEIVNNNPGGEATTGSFQNAIDGFFNKYFSQSFFRASGIGKYLETQSLYKKNVSSGMKLGRSAGVSTGYTWIANAAIGGQ